ncbi:hypothetical protein PAMP_001171 [Pampus punctatissimus]
MEPEVGTQRIRSGSKSYGAAAAACQFFHSLVCSSLYLLSLQSPQGIQQQLSSYRETVIRQATAATGSAVHRDDAPTCGICHKTKFADGCGNLCSYCQTKFCARCGGRVSLRSNTGSLSAVMAEL